MLVSQTPFAITSEAADYLQTLGLQAELEEIVEKLPELFPELLRIECQYDEGIEDESDPMFIINAWLAADGPTDPTPLARWSPWMLERFPVEVWQHLCVLHWHEAPDHARA